MGTTDNMESMSQKLALTLKDVAQATQGKIINGSDDDVMSSLSTDTRHLKKNDWYLALCGSNFDGHDFINEALEKGAAGVVVSKKIDLSSLKVAVLQVEDTLKALGDIAHFWRKRFDIPVVAITGSNGKTTTKEMLAQCLLAAGTVLKTAGNLNNLVGLPLTLLQLNAEHQFAVVEMGMNAPGEIARLTAIAEPTIGLITNVGRAHLGGFENEEGIARAKGELFWGLSSSAMAVVNMDDRSIPFIGDGSGPFADDPLLSCLRFRYGWQMASEEVYTPDLLCTDVVMGEKEMHVVVQMGGDEKTFILPVVGRHYVYSFLATYSVCSILGVEDEVVQRGLDAFIAPNMRDELIETAGKYTLVNDCYNANPDSMENALINLNERFSARRKIAVLGEMFELGENSARLHEEVGAMAASKKVDVLLAFGSQQQAMLKGFKARSKNEAYGFEDFDALVAKLKERVRKGDVVLVKGSRGSRMERIIEALG